jgi:hypothetical protein
MVGCMRSMKESCKKLSKKEARAWLVKKCGRLEGARIKFLSHPTFSLFVTFYMLVRGDDITVIFITWMLITLFFGCFYILIRGELFYRHLKREGVIIF